MGVTNCQLEDIPVASCRPAPERTNTERQTVGSGRCPLYRIDAAERLSYRSGIDTTTRRAANSTGPSPLARAAHACRSIEAGPSRRKAVTCRHPDNQGGTRTPRIQSGSVTGTTRPGPSTPCRVPSLTRWLPSRRSVRRRRNLATRPRHRLHDRDRSSCRHRRSVACAMTTLAITSNSPKETARVPPPSLPRHRPVNVVRRHPGLSGPGGRGHPATRTPTPAPPSCDF